MIGHWWLNSVSSPSPFSHCWGVGLKVPTLYSHGNFSWHHPSLEALQESPATSHVVSIWKDSDHQGFGELQPGEVIKTKYVFLTTTHISQCPNNLEVQTLEDRWEEIQKLIMKCKYLKFNMCSLNSVYFSKLLKKISCHGNFSDFFT